MSLWPLSAKTLAAILQAQVRGSLEAAARRAVTDSRAGVGPGDLFVGLRGPHFDGGSFAQHALEDGASIVLIASDSPPIELPEGRAELRVPDPLSALQTLAAEARDAFGGTVLAITGSNGKTLTKELLSLASSGQLRLSVSPLSYNSQVGVALSLLDLDPEAELAILECGISLPGEMQRLQAMVRPDLGILTLIGEAHLEGLKTREGIAREKSALFRSLPEGGWVLMPRGEREVRAELAGEELLLLGGEGDPHPRRCGAVLELAPGVRLTLRLGRSEEIFLHDAALAAVAAWRVGVSPAAIEQALEGWSPPPMRLEYSRTPAGVEILNDACTSDPHSVEGALRALVRGLQAPRRSFAVLGGMAQQGQASRAAHARIGARVCELGVDRLIGVGHGGEMIALSAREAGMSPEAAGCVESPEEAATQIALEARRGDRVLLKGSRPQRLERVHESLSDALSPARLEVNLDALASNVQALRQRAAGAELLAVVKAFGYGLDSAAIARTLEDQGVAHFSVAYPDEGVRLRQAGVTRPILVHNPVVGQLGKLIQHGLSAQIGQADLLEPLSQAAREQRRVARVHLKVDSGMGRSGLWPAEVLPFAEAVAEDPWLRLDGLMTHFAWADEPEGAAFTRDQIRRFEEVRRALLGAGLQPRWVHACNSAGLALYPEARYSLVRAGLGLLGYLQVGGEAPLEQLPSLRLVTRLLSVRELPAGQGVGYGQTWSTGSQPRRVGLVALGYADGYPWSLSGRGWMSIRGRRCEVLGRVSMDVITLDLSALDGCSLAPGEEVVVFGGGTGEPDLLALAEAAGTLPYELLTRISPRVRRVYLRGR